MRLPFHCGTLRDWRNVPLGVKQRHTEKCKLFTKWFPCVSPSQTKPQQFVRYIRLFKQRLSTNHLTQVKYTMLFVNRRSGNKISACRLERGDRLALYSVKAFHSYQCLLYLFLSLLFQNNQNVIPKLSHRSQFLRLAWLSSETSRSNSMTIK